MLPAPQEGPGDRVGVAQPRAAPPGHGSLPPATLRFPLPTTGPWGHVTFPSPGDLAVSPGGSGLMVSLGHGNPVQGRRGLA